MSCGWEGHRRSGVTLATRHRLQWFIHLRPHGLDEDLAYTPRGAWHSFFCQPLPQLQPGGQMSGEGANVRSRSTRLGGTVSHLSSAAVLAMTDDRSRPLDPTVRVHSTQTETYIYTHAPADVRGEIPLTTCGIRIAYTCACVSRLAAGRRARLPGSARHAVRSPIDHELLTLVRQSTMSNYTCNLALCSRATSTIIPRRRPSVQQHEEFRARQFQMTLTQQLPKPGPHQRVVNAAEIQRFVWNSLERTVFS